MIAAALEEAAYRIRLFRVPVADSLRRLWRSPRAAWGTTFAHAGAGMVIIGIVASSAWQVEKLQIMQPGESVSVGSYEFKFEGAAPIPGPNYEAVRGIFQVSRDGKDIAVMQPESRKYQDPPMDTTEAAIRTGWGGDLYAVIGDPTGDIVSARRCEARRAQRLRQRCQRGRNRQRRWSQNNVHRSKRSEFGRDTAPHLATHGASRRCIAYWWFFIRWLELAPKRNSIRLDWQGRADIRPPRPARTAKRSQISRFERPSIPGQCFCFMVRFMPGGTSLVHEVEGAKYRAGAWPQLQG
jgi:hypothetical protein